MRKRPELAKKKREKIHKNAEITKRSLMEHKTAKTSKISAGKKHKKLKLPKRDWKCKKI